MSLKIGALAKRTDCKVETIRFYEKEGLLPEPGRTEGNFRLYGESHVERLRFIRHCRSLDMTLEEIRVLLGYRDTPERTCDAINDLVDTHIHQVDERMAELQSLKAHLLALREKCGSTRPAERCGILQGLSDGSCHGTG
ncbi:Cd(II)/Pb(II)-responsive transcriptional regulator [Nitrincola sp. MINF-07-Sa-05]|uniref:Cd(II)/Pb(II)-responsive transcriptional regulator n=1 Tax=Nitrincola salilacus TaxID=3400273 RepID=UPI00391805EE